MIRLGRALQLCGAWLMVLALFTGATLLWCIAMPADPALPDASPSSTAPPSAQPEPSPTPPDVDLSARTFTATGSLTASFVSPKDGTAADVTATQAVVATQRGAGIELACNGTVVDPKHIGKRTVATLTGETRYFYYGVPLVAGPNTCTATPLGAGDLRGSPSSIVVYGPAEPNSIRAEFGARLVADGKSSVPLNVTIVDRFGHAAIPAQRVRVAILSGDARFEDLPNDLTVAAQPSPNVVASAATQARVAELPLPVGGYFALRLASGTVAGNVEIEFRAGNAYLRKSFYVEPFVRGAFVNGLVSGGAGSVPGAIDGDGVPDNGGARRNRLAIFATGAVGKSLVTVDYESQNRLSPVSSYGPFVDDPNERPYLTYGDASQVVSSYHSSDHLYARIDRGRSNVMWGQFDAHAGPNDVGTYEQLLSGAKAEVSAGRDARANLSAFTARNDSAFVSQVLQVSGLAALLQSLHPGIVVGSESLNLVTLDRQTGLALRQQLLLRNVDYTIDYATGVLRFINVPLPFDAQFNPQVISLQYEYAGPGVRSQTTGGQISYDLARDKHTHLLASYVGDATGTQNFALSAQSFVRTWSSGQLAISHAQSYGVLPNPANASQLVGTVVPSGGNAVSAALDDRGRNGALSLAYQSTTAGYDDPFGGFSTPGTTAYRAAWSRGSQGRGLLTVAYSAALNRGVGSDGRESDFAMQFVRSVGKSLTATLGLIEHDQRIATAPAASPGALASTSQTQIQGALDYRMPKRLGVSVGETLTVAGSDVGSTPTETTVQTLLRFTASWTPIRTGTVEHAAVGDVREFYDESEYWNQFHAFRTIRHRAAALACDDRQFAVRRRSNRFGNERLCRDRDRRTFAHRQAHYGQRTVSSGQRCRCRSVRFHPSRDRPQLCGRAERLPLLSRVSRSHRLRRRLDVLGRTCRTHLPGALGARNGATRLRERRRRRERSPFTRLSPARQRCADLSLRLLALERRSAGR